MSRTYRDEMFIQTFEHEYTWLNGFLRNVRRYGDKVAVIDPITDRTWSYRQLNAEANRLAHALRGDGVGKDDVVMTALMNCPEFAVSYIGPRKVGAILNLANFNLSPYELSLLIEFNQPKVFMYSADIADKAVEALQMAEHRPERAIMADNLKGIALPEGHVSYEDYSAMLESPG